MSVFKRFIRNSVMTVLVGGLFSQAQASDPALPLNKLKISNRAQCAVDSQKPTASIFLLLDGYNAGKAAHTLAKNIGADADQMSLESMREFRLASSAMLTDIMNRLLTGQLPLLPMNIKSEPLKVYASLLKSCTGKVYCEALNSYLGKIWQVSNRRLAGENILWSTIDNFTTDNVLTYKGANHISCSYVKRFSALQGHLHTPTIDRLGLQEMAQAWVERSKYITHCMDADPNLDSRNSVVQLDVKTGDPDEWNQKGFDFWNSVKIYLSWAWRNSNLPAKSSPRFAEMFRSVALEESLMLVPNGCGSVTKPECDGETLSMNSLRELAAPNSKDTEHIVPVPEGPEKGLIEKGPRSVNDDFLGTQSFESASEWLANFRKNYVQARGSMKNRLQTSVQFLNMLSDSMKPAQLTEFVKPLAFSKEISSGHRDELYYLCTELRLAGDKRIDFLKSDIDQISQLSVMNKAFEGSDKTPQDVVNYFDELSRGVLPFCDALETTNTWNIKDYIVNKAGFQDWAKQLLSISDPATTTTEIKPLAYGPPLLVWNATQGNIEGNVICMSGIDCARKAIRAMVDLHAVAKYAEAFLPVSSTVNSPDVFNPYSELAACKIYDPWFVTKRNNRRLMADLASTALFGWNFLPLYVDVDFTAPKVTSFNQLVQNGVIKFDPNIQKSKMEASLIADFGPLLGAPCAVSIAPTSAKNFDFYAFKGISVNYCDIKSRGQVVGDSDGSLNPREPKSRAYCGGCSLNFVGVASGVAVSSASSGLSLNPIKLGVYLFRAVHRFLTGKKDKVNIPQTFEVDLAKTAEVYKKYGTIPEKCVSMLGQGYSCHEDICEAKAAEFFERYTHGKIHSISTHDAEQDPKTGLPARSAYRRSWIRSSVCDGDITLSFTCSGNGENFKTQKRRGGLYGVSKDCRNFLGHNFWGF
ncbi:hypothetical protein EZJ49_05555 [Bdellovibrio bacteriovorus]|uniref:hypothetical protein n=1 Tax=Bdellovibrio bacteriovorus TaxID=959 RepID=UPI0021D0236F|nr:hypothetical protein [Bdellovibrio bacteriovorus]UXR65713.1 hypothetical protein EZJ49_05555 [Bdellovibrio bacteriovorus]